MYVVVNNTHVPIDIKNQNAKFLPKKNNLHFKDLSCKQLCCFLYTRWAKNTYNFEKILQLEECKVYNCATWF